MKDLETFLGETGSWGNKLQKAPFDKLSAKQIRLIKTCHFYFNPIGKKPPEALKQQQLKSRILLARVIFGLPKSLSIGQNS